MSRRDDQKKIVERRFIKALSSGKVQGQMRLTLACGHIIWMPVKKIPVLGFVKCPNCNPGTRADCPQK